MKAAVQTQALARGVAVSVFVREVLTRCTGAVDADNVEADLHTAGRIRISMRLREDEARDLVRRARQAGRPLGMYVIELAADSTGQRNTFAELLSGRAEAKRFAWPAVQLSGNGIELKL